MQWQNYNPEAETAVLSSLIHDNSCIPEVLAYLKPDDFFFEPNRHMAGACFSLAEKNMPVDIVTLMSELEQAKTLNKAGGVERVFEVSAMFLTSANVGYYAQELKRLSEARKVVKFAESIIKGETEATAETLMRNADELIKASPLSMDDGLGHYEAFSANLHDKKPSLETGFAKLDNVTGGLAIPSVAVIGAYSSVGKTAFTLNIAMNQKLPVVFISLEMNANKLIERLISAHLEIPYGKVQRRDIVFDEAKDIGWLMEYLRERKFAMFYDAYYIEQHEAIIARLKPSLVVVDYLQLVRSHHKSENRRALTDHVSQTYQAMAKRHNCVIILLSQFSRPLKATKKHRPTMSDLKESGGIENDADYVCILHRDYVLQKGSKDIREEDGYLLIDKNRYGMTGEIKLEFIGKYQQFREVDFQGDGLAYVDGGNDDEF